ncbi:hypothetical protein EVAR_59699_1 [Eumeta japonica]|uniref:Uncharacterized protein n=1 Tax=Eumeta variegata TaxID=151549 RepID=A0A4C1ZCM6_EUMVA|nr:hypothetical protein EVAR_59699_1 [Eumeta japonica]
MDWTTNNHRRLIIPIKSSVTRSDQFQTVRRKKVGFAVFAHESFSISPYLPHRVTVKEVVEIRDSGGGFIHGKVTPQTRVNNRPYDVKVELITALKRFHEGRLLFLQRFVAFACPPPVSGERSFLSQVRARSAFFHQHADAQSDNV